MANQPRIVVFEDSEADVILLRLTLDTEIGNYEFVQVGDGDEAAALVKSYARGAAHADLFVIDLNLPKRSGLEILGDIREHEELRAVPAVVLTSSESPRDRKAAEELGISAFVRKPIHLAEYLAIGAVLKRCLRDS